MNNQVIEWAPRVPQSLIWQLYQSDAYGFADIELVDEVGWRLLARCRSFILAVEAVSGRVVCPVCKQEIFHTGDKEAILHCSGCGWEIMWGDLFATIQHQQLSGAEAVVRLFGDFVQHFPLAETYSQKMLLVDALIHGFHIYFKDGSQTRTTGVNLIEGRYLEVVDFLDQLSYSSSSTAGLMGTYLTWRQKIDETGRKWRDDRLRRW